MRAATLSAGSLARLRPSDHPHHVHSAEHLAALVAVNAAVVTLTEVFWPEPGQPCPDPAAAMDRLIEALDALDDPAACTGWPLSAQPADRAALWAIVTEARRLRAQGKAAHGADRAAWTAEMFATMARLLELVSPCPASADPSPG